MSVHLSSFRTALVLSVAALCCWQSSEALAQSAPVADAGAPTSDAGSAAPDAAPVPGGDAGVAAVVIDANVVGSDATVVALPADVATGADAQTTAQMTVPQAEPAAAEASGATASGPQRSRPSATLKGSVVSADDEVGIDGASVYVRGTSEQTQTDGSGAFALTLPAGTYQLSIIFPGYSTQNVSNVELRPNQTATLSIKLRPGSVELDEMVVTGSRVKGGIATLIAERRESKAVADVIGAEQMSRSGDSNAASALSRVTGITVIDGRYVIVRGMGERYSTMTLNRLQVASPDPTRRVVPLDIFPAGVIDSVVVQKSYSPDLPGEFGGGLVQLRSRDYPHEFSFNLNAAVGGNFSTLFKDRLSYRGSSTDILGIDDGKRELPGSFNDPRGKITTSDYTQEEIDELGRKLPHAYNTYRETTMPDVTLGANIGNEWRLRFAKIGFVTAIGYRSENRNVLNAINRVFKGDEVEDYRLDTYRRQISLSGFLDWGVVFSAAHKLKFTSMLLRQTDDSSQYREDVFDPQLRGGPEAEGTLSIRKDRTVLQWVERQVFLQQVNGSHAIEKAHNLQIDWRYAYGLASRLEPSRATYEYVREMEQRLYPVNQGNSNVFSNLTDHTHEASLDLAQLFSIWKHLEAKAKLGGLFYKRDRDADTRNFSYALEDSEADRSERPGDLLADYRIGDGVRFEEITLPTDAYKADMTLAAGYANLDLPLHRTLEIGGGARLEHALIEVQTLNAFDPTAESVKARLKNLDVLPAAGLTWRFVEDFQARLGYSRTLNRPDFRELAESRYYDLETNLLLVGNSKVKRAMIENFDARVEWFYTPDEVFSIGGFLKRFDQPIENKMQAAQEDVFTVENVDKAISYGLEIEGRKKFGFITKALEALYLAANFSLINSEVKVPLIEKDEDGNDQFHKRPLQGQSPWVINAQLGWDDTDGTGTSASLLFNSAGKRIRFVGDPDNNRGDIYELPVHRLDFVISQKLPRGFKLGARVRNILNARETWVAKGGPMNEEQTWRRFRRGADFQLSLSWNY